MQVKSNLMYKGFKKRPAGSFTDKKTGKLVEYGEKIILLCDDFDENKIPKEIELNFSIQNNKALADKIVNLSPYQILPFSLNIDLSKLTIQLLDIDIAKAKLHE